LSIQQKVYSLLPYGVLCFLFVMFASPNSKLANQLFYLLVLLPGLMSLDLVIKNRQAYIALWPIVVLVFFWATFSLVQLDLAGWDNVAKRFRHGLYVAVFFTSSYCLLSANLISVRRLVFYLFCLAVSYSFVSFVYFYWINGRSLDLRLLPFLRLDSPIFMAIILVVYGVPLMQWLADNKRRVIAIVVFFSIVFFLYFYNSRSAMVGLLFGIVGMLFLGRNVNQKKFGVFILLMLISCLIASYFYGNILNRGLSHRVDIWLSSLSKIVECGVFTGCGFEGSSKITIASGLSFQHPHNIFLSHFVSTGLLGLLSLLALLSYVIYHGVRVRSTMILGLVVGLVSLFFDGNALLTSPDALWLIFWMPLVMTYWEINESKTKYS